MNDPREQAHGYDRLRRLTDPGDLTPARRRALYTEIERKLRPERGTPSPRFAFAGAVAVAAACAFLVFGDAADAPSPPAAAAADVALTDELLLWSDLIDAPDSESLPEQYDAVAVVFLDF